MSGAAQPQVSVICANYNGARHLSEAIRSVLDQSLAELELIIVDDASTDDSLEVIAQAAAGDPRVRVLRQARNGGPGRARNRAIDEARGRWIAVFDSDDVMARDRLERLLHCAEAQGADIVADNLSVFLDGHDDADEPLLKSAAYKAPRWIELADYIASSRMYAKHPGLGYLKPLIRADALVRTGVRYRQWLKIGEDYDFVLRLLANGCRMWLEPVALYRYRRHAGSTSHRMKPDHLAQMLAADADAELPTQPAAVRRAQAVRRRSLEAALAYERVVERLKARDLAGGIAGAARPDVWPLLTLPIVARMKRLRRAAPAMA